MPDHIHLFCATGRMPMPSLRQWVEYWNGQIAVQWTWDADERGMEGTGMDDTAVVPLVPSMGLHESEGRPSPACHNAQASVGLKNFFNYSIAPMRLNLVTRYGFG